MEMSLNIQGRNVEVSHQLSEELYICQDTTSPISYLLKSVPSPSIHRKRLLQNEVHLLKELNPHPHIISLQAVTTQPFMMLYEFCTHTLADKRPSDPLKALYQLSVAVKHMHSRSVPILHRNLVPENVFELEGCFKISGFEHSTEMYANLTEMETGGEGGDPKWKAPEMLDMNPHLSLDTKVDIWGLGMLLYYMVFEKVPFENQEAQKEGKFEISQEVPWKIRDLLGMMLNPNPSTRADIENILSKFEEQKPQGLESCKLCCFKSRGLYRFKSGRSTVKLIRNFVNTGRDAFLKKLVEKAWAKTQKIPKFYSEIMNLQGLENPQYRLKACLLLFSYLQDGPLLVYESRPGVIEVVNYIESYCCVRPGHPLKNDLFRRMTNALASTIKEKYYITNENMAVLNGRFVIKQENFQTLSREGSIRLLEQLLSYWNLLIKSQEILAQKSALDELRRTLRYSLIKEQVRLLEVVNPHIQMLPDYKSEYLKVYHKAKTLFELDRQCMPPCPVSIESFPELLIDNPLSQVSESSVSLDETEEVEQTQESPYYSLQQGFSPMTLQQNPGKEGLNSNLFQCELIDLSQESVSNFKKFVNKSLENWEIDINEIKKIRQIGKGSSCEVWLGAYRKTQVAIKQLKEVESGNLKEFGREVTIVAKLRHPNLVLFLGAYLGSPLTIVSEYCSGGDLFHLLHRKKQVFISWEQKLKMCSDIARAMNFLHSHSFIHRDLKSLNVLLESPLQHVTDQVNLKVSDFGLSKSYTEEMYMTGSLGTCHWMAPEVLTTSSYTLKADVYSFAIVMYEIITREVPYKGLSHEEIRDKVLNGHQRPDLEVIPPNCPKALLKLMGMCWRSDPDKRPHFSAIVDLLSAIQPPKN